MYSLHSIIRKCDRNKYPEWCGYLQPAEILRLMDSGMISVNKWNEVYVARAKVDKAKGRCNATWFYFYPNKKFIELHRGLKKK